MRSKAGSLLLILGLSVLVLVFILLLFGATKSIRSGNGFLFIPSVTQTSSATWTSSPTSTFTTVPSQTPVPTSTLTPTNTLTATITLTPSATFDLDGYLVAYLSDITATAAMQMTLAVPTSTALVADADLVSGMLMKGETDSADLIYIRTNSAKAPVSSGFWLDLLEVTNEQYSACVAAGICSKPENEKCGEIVDYYSNLKYANSPVVNLTWQQADDYCRWTHMNLLTKDAWLASVAYDKTELTDVIADGESLPGEYIINSDQLELSGLWGSVWEWLADDVNGEKLIAGGSWRTAKSDIGKRSFGSMRRNETADDVGLRCMRVNYR